MQINSIAKSMIFEENVYILYEEPLKRSWLQHAALQYIYMYTAVIGSGTSGAE